MGSSERMLGALDRFGGGRRPPVERHCKTRRAPRLARIARLLRVGQCALERLFLFPPSTTHPVHVGDPTPGLGEAEVIGGRFEFGNRIVGNAPKMFDADVRLRRRAGNACSSCACSSTRRSPAAAPAAIASCRTASAQALRQRRARRPTQAAVASGRAHLAGATPPRPSNLAAARRRPRQAPVHPPPRGDAPRGRLDPPRDRRWERARRGNCGRLLQVVADDLFDLNKPVAGSCLDERREPFMQLGGHSSGSRRTRCPG